MSRGMSNALSVAGSGVGGAEKAHDMLTTKGKFLSAGSKELMSASVTDSAGQASAMSKKAPEVAISIASGGAKLTAQAAVTAVKAALTATGAGAGVAAAIDTAQTVITKVADKAMEKMQSGMEQGNSVMKQGSSTASLSNTLQAMDQDKAKMEGPVKDVKEAVGEVKDAAMTGVNAAKGAAGGATGAPGAETGASDLSGPASDTSSVSPDLSLGAPSTSPDPMSTQVYGDMQDRAARDGDLLPQFTQEGVAGSTGIRSIADPITLEQDRMGDPLYMDPSSDKSPLRFVGEEGRNQVVQSFEGTMRGQGIGMSAPEMGPAANRLAEISQEANESISAAKAAVPYQEDLSAWTSARNQAGERALGDAATANGLTLEDVKQRLLSEEVGKANPAERDAYQSFLTNKFNDPSTRVFENLYLDRGGEAIASLKAERALGAASGIMQGGVIPGLPASDAKIDMAAQVAAERLGGNVPAIKADMLGQLAARGEGPAREALQAVGNRIDTTHGLTDASKDAMKVRIEQMTTAKLASPAQGQGWQAMGDYLMTGARGPMADNLTARVLITKASEAAKRANNGQL